MWYRKVDDRRANEVFGEGEAGAKTEGDVDVRLR